MSSPGDPHGYLERLSKAVEHLATSADSLPKRLKAAWDSEVSILASEHYPETYDKQEELRAIGKLIQGNVFTLAVEDQEAVAQRLYNVHGQIALDVHYAVEPT